MWQYGVTVGPLLVYYLERRRDLKPVQVRAEEELVGATLGEVRETIDRVELTEDDLRGVMSEVGRRYPGTDAVAPELVGQVVREAIVHEDATFQPWELLALYRLSPEDEHGRVPLPELCVGLAQLATVAGDEDLPEFAELDEVDDRRQSFERLRIMSEVAGRRRLSLLWTALDRTGAGALTRDELERGVERMLRTGHVRPLSLVRKTSQLPPRYALASAADVAGLVFADLGLDAAAGDRVGRDGFEREMRELTKADLFTLWYLEDTRQGLLKRVYEKRRHRAVRSLRARGYDV